MTRQRRWALGLWAVLAVVVFNVVFDWQPPSRAWSSPGRRRPPRQRATLPTLNEGVYAHGSRGRRPLERVVRPDSRDRRRGHRRRFPNEEVDARFPDLRLEQDRRAGPPQRVMLDDETLRDGLQSPSVPTPTIDAENRDPAPDGPAGHRHGRHRLARRRASRVARRRAAGPRDRRRQLQVRPNCAARTTISRHQADRRDHAAHRAADRGRRVHRLVADPAVRRGLDDRLAAEAAPRTRSPSRWRRASR